MLEQTGPKAMGLVPILDSYVLCVEKMAILKNYWFLVCYTKFKNLSVCLPSQRTDNFLKITKLSIKILNQCYMWIGLLLGPSDRILILENLENESVILKNLSWTFKFVTLFKVGSIQRYRETNVEYWKRGKLMKLRNKELILTSELKNV